MLRPCTASVGSQRLGGLLGEIGMTQSTTSPEAFLAQWEHSVQRYRQCLHDGHRIGQAFFNALPGEVAVYLVGTLSDPFYRDDIVPQAMHFLRDKGLAR